MKGWTVMRRVFLLVALGLIVTASLIGQPSYTSNGPNGERIDAADECASLGVGGYGKASIEVIATPSFSGTITFYVVGAGGTVTTVDATPPNSATSVTSTTAAGQWSVTVASYAGLRACFTSYTSGAATVYLSASVASAYSGGGGFVSPPAATYITQTANGTLTAEQALAALSSGILRAATTTGVITSLGDTLPIANGGLGVVLVDPNADRLIGWDDSAGAHIYFTLGTNLSTTGTTLNAAGGSPGGMDTYVQYNDEGAFGGDSGFTFNETTNLVTLGAIYAIQPTDAVPLIRLTNSMGGDAFFNIYDNGDFEIQAGTSYFGHVDMGAWYITEGLDIGSAGVRLNDDGDGALTFLGLGNGSDEDLAFNFDDVANTVGVSSSTGVTVVDFGNIVLDGGYITSGTTPSVANVGANSCGTDAATITGNSNSGRVTVGATSGTQCRVTTTVTAPTGWQCSVSNTTTAALARCVGVDTTHFDLLGVFTAADVLSYVALPN